MVTKREWAVKQGLAKPGKGRFSREALDAIAKAEAEGMKFDEPVVKAPSTPRAPATQKAPKEVAKGKADPKAVRAWARENGIQVGDKGRIHASVINQYLDAQAKAGTPVKDIPTPLDVFGPARPRLRSADRFVAVEPSGSKVSLSHKDCCSNCKYSLGWCSCRIPRTFSREDTGLLLELTPQD